MPFIADGSPRRAATACRPRIAAAAAGALLVLLGGCARHEFLRISQDSCGGRLEAAWVWFDPPQGYPPVLLVNMIHFGTQDYYAEVQAELDRASVVFIEGIREGESRESRPSADTLSQLDRATADLAFELRLVTQRETLAVRPGYVCVDWTADELRARAPVDKYLSGVSRMRDTVQRIVDHEAEALRSEYPELSHEDLSNFVRRGPLRRQIAERLTQVPIEDPAIIKGRNEPVLRALLGIAPSGLVAICYGADHGPHLARSLEALGYARRATTWHKVFGFDREPHPDVIPQP
jgi:hypothetical protein